MPTYYGYANLDVTGNVPASQLGNAPGGSGVLVPILVTYDFTVDGGAVGFITPTGAPTLPDNTMCWLQSYDVITAPTSATSNATIALGFATDGDFNAGIDLNGVAWVINTFLPWAGNNQDGYCANSVPVKLSAARTPRLTIGVENLTAGKIIFQLSYWQSA